MKTILIAAAFILALAVILPIGIKKHEQAECHEWVQMASEYVGYYSTQWQKDQCSHYGIELKK